MATDSRLPRWFDDVPRGRVSVEMCDYAWIGGRRTRFFLYDEDRNVVSKKDGRSLLDHPLTIVPGYPGFDLVVVDGPTDVIERSRPFRMARSADIWRAVAETAGVHESPAHVDVPSDSPRCTHDGSPAIEQALRRATELLQTCRQSQREHARSTQEPCGLFREFFQGRLLECLSFTNEVASSAEGPQVLRALFAFVREMGPTLGPPLDVALADAFEAKPEEFESQVRSMPDAVRNAMVDGLLRAYRRKGTSSHDAEMVARGEKLRGGGAGDRPAPLPAP